MTNTTELYGYAIDMLNRNMIKYEADEFKSGARMIDIWYKDKFYVLQFDLNYIGFSEVGDDVPFTTEPEKKIFSGNEFKDLLRSILS
jgi:hypothetical protein